MTAPHPMPTAAHFAMNPSPPARRAFVCLAAAAAALSGPAAQAQADAPPAWYAGVQLGASHVSGWPARVDFGGVSVDGRLALGDGRHAALLLGRRHGPWRFELEAQRGTLPIEQARLGAVTQAVDADGRYRAFTANVLRVIPLAQRWNALAGLGLGVAEVSLPAIGLANGCRCFAESSDRAATVQARLGLEWEAAPGWRVQLAGSWLRLPGPAAASGNIGTRYERRDALTADLGLLVHF